MRLEKNYPEHRPSPYKNYKIESETMNKNIFF